MTDPEARLDAGLPALLGEDLPPGRDPAFRLAVLERLARRDARRRLAAVLAAGVAATGLVAALSPGLTAQLPVLAGSGLLSALGLAVAAAATLWGLGRMRRPI